MTTRRRWTVGLILAPVVLGLVVIGFALFRAQSGPHELRLVFLGMNPDINSPLSLASRPQRALFRITNSGPVRVRINNLFFAYEGRHGNGWRHRYSLDQRVLEPGKSLELESPGIHTDRTCQLQVDFSPESLSGRLSRKYHSSTNVMARVVGRRLFPFRAFSTNSGRITNSSASHKKDMQVINR